MIQGPPPGSPGIAAKRTAPEVATRGATSRAAAQPPQRLQTEEDAWQQLKPGLYFSLFVTTSLAFMKWRRIWFDENPARLLALLIALFAVHSLLVSPRRLLLLFVAYIPYSILYPFKLAPTANLTNLLLGAVLLASLMGPRQPHRRVPFGLPDYLVLLYLVLALLSHLYAWLQLGDVGPLGFLMQYKAWGSPLLVYFLCRRLLLARADVRAVLIVLLVGTTLVGLISWSEGVDRRAGSIEKSRIEGIMQQPNDHGAFLVYYGMPLLATALLAKRWTIKVAAFVAYGIVGYACIFTYSRGAYLSMALAAFTVLLLRSPLYCALSVVLYVAAAAFFPVLIPDAVLTRFGHTQQGSSRIYADDPVERLDASAAKRLAAWRAAGKMMIENPILGVGLGRYLTVVREYHEQEKVFDSHNAYLRTGGELGLPAMVTMLCMFLALLLRALSVYRRAERPLDCIVALGFVGSVLGVLASCMFGSRFHVEALTSNFWVLAAMVTFTGALLSHPESSSGDSRARPPVLSELAGPA